MTHSLLECTQPQAYNKHVKGTSILKTGAGHFTTCLIQEYMIDSKIQ